MAWERRRDGLYQYRSHRIGRRVVKEYAGCGPGAALVAELDAAGRAEREAERQAKAAELERVLAVAEPLVDLPALMEALASEALKAAGYQISCVIRTLQRDSWPVPSLSSPGGSNGTCTGRS
jgi:hypothetical protein